MQKRLLCVSSMWPRILLFATLKVCKTASVFNIVDSYFHCWNYSYAAHNAHGHYQTDRMRIAAQRAGCSTTSTHRR